MTQTIKQYMAECGAVGKLMQMKRPYDSNRDSRGDTDKDGLVTKETFVVKLTAGQAVRGLVLASDDKLVYENAGNKSCVKENELQKAKDSFHGEAPATLGDWMQNGTFDLTPCREALAELKKKGLTKRIKDACQGLVKERTRVLSEYDGDYDHDRRFDPECYQATTMAVGQGHTIKLLANFSMSAGVDAAKINKYGAMVWAVSQLLEDAGFVCSIDIVNTGQSLFSGSDAAHSIQVEVKKAGSYINPKVLGAVFNNTFKRRAIFWCLPVACELSGHTAQSNYGYPVSVTGGKPFLHEKGTIILDPGCVDSPVDKFADVVVEAVKYTVSQV